MISDEHWNTPAYDFIYWIINWILFCVFMLQLQLGKRPTTVSQPKVGAGFLPPQTCLGFSWSVGHSEGHCNICIFLKNWFCAKPLPHLFPVSFSYPVFQIFKFFLVKAQCLKFCLVQILSDLDSKGGACLGPMSGPFYPVPSFYPHFTNVHFYPHLFLLFLFIYLNLERLSDSCK